MADRDALIKQYHQLAREHAECVAGCKHSLEKLQAFKRELSEVLGEAADSLPTAHDPDTDWSTPPLSSREVQVFTLIGQGLTTQQISQQLGIQSSTVETYRERLKTKLKVESGAALIRRAVLWLVGPRFEDQS